MTNRDKINQMNNKDLSNFIINIAPRIGIVYTDSVCGLEDFLDKHKTSRGKGKLGSSGK